MKNTILKSILALGVIAFTVTLSQCSCGKSPAAGGSNNSGNGNNGGDNDPPLVATTNLTLSVVAGFPTNYIKTSGNTVTISAAGLAGAITPHSTANDNSRGFQDVVDNLGGGNVSIFNIGYPGATAVLFFVNRTHVTKDSITMRATLRTECATSSETADDALAAAAGGGTCRVYFTSGGTDIYFNSYLGTVFNNTNTAASARGTLRCSEGLRKATPGPGSVLSVIDDTVVFNNPGSVPCSIAVVNNAGTAATAEIDDAWVGDAASTTEVELYAIGINVSGKTISQFSDAPGYNLAAFIDAHDNAGFKRLLRTNPWGELKFKVKIVASANF